MRNSNKGPLSIVGFILRVLYILMLILLIYLVIDFGGNSKDILSQYMSLTSDSKSDFSKSLQFLKTYTQTTGDITLALNTGMSKEDAEELLEEGNINVSGTPGLSQGAGTHGIMTAWDASNAWDAIEQHCKSWGYTSGRGGNSPNWKVVDVNGSTYIWQSQNAIWSNVGSGGNNTMEKVGCMFFCLSAAASNLNGVVCGVEDVLAGLDYHVSFESSTNKFKTQETVGRVGADSSYRHPNGTYASLFNMIEAAGLNYDKNEGEAKSIDESRLSSGMYLCHVMYDTGGVIASQSSGQHWFLIVGSDAQYYYIINVDQSKTRVEKDFINSRVNTNKLNHCVYVTGK